MLDNTMPLEKIPAILFVGYGIQVSLTSLTPATPKNERRMENANWFANFLKVSNFGASQTHQLTSIKAVSRICTIIKICIIVAGMTKTTWSKDGVVRHPSYTGMILMLVGEVIWYTPRGSWLRESIVYQMKLSWLLIASICFLSYL